jgi:hypothetical protein
MSERLNIYKEFADKLARESLVAKQDTRDPEVTCLSLAHKETVISKLKQEIAILEERISIVENIISALVDIIYVEEREEEQ